MIKTIRSLAFLAVLASITLAQSSDVKSMVKIYEDVRGKDGVVLDTCANLKENEIQVFWATQDKIAQCPEWDGKAKPPLTLNEAISVARAYIQETHHKITDCNLDFCIISQIDAETENRWYYKVRFQAKLSDDGKQFNKLFHIIVLMDKTIIKPEVYSQ